MGCGGVEGLEVEVSRVRGEKDWAGSGKKRVGK